MLAVTYAAFSLFFGLLAVYPGICLGKAIG
jgi:hypothetical protein